MKRIKEIFIVHVYNSKSINLYRLSAALFFIKRNRRLRYKVKFKCNKVFSQKPKINIDKGLPPLSWLLTIKSDEVVIRAGAKVEHKTNAIFEGAWLGDFRKFRPEDAQFVFGSGVKITDKNITIITPKHTLESVFMVYNKISDSSYVSNSMVYAIKSSGAIHNKNFTANLQKTLQDSADTAANLGVDRYNNIIIETNMFILLRLTYFNYKINNKGRLQPIWSPIKKYFNSYESYNYFLKNTMDSIIANSKDSSRSHKYNPVIAISRGYDSTAVSALASQIGVKESITIGAKAWGVSDSGADNGKILGLKVHTVKHILSNNLKSLNLNIPVEIEEQAYEFLATDGIGDDMGFLGFEKYLKNKVYMSGTYGDVVWKDDGEFSNGLQKKVYERSLGEFRLRVGFINFPVISLGARFQYPITRINKNTKMYLYRIDGTYSRPIPRRMVEDMGVPRNAFGMQKRAMSPRALNGVALINKALCSVANRYV